MELKREIVRCHTCNNVQRDRQAYRDHLLCAHGEVARRGSDTPVRIEGRELAVVWATAHCARMSGPVRAARRTEALGLPRVLDREAERLLKDNRARTARRHRAAARMRGLATAALGAPEVMATTEDIGGQGGVDRELGGRYRAQIGSSQAQPQTELVPQLRGGGARRAFSPCERCTHCPCRQDRDYGAAQDSAPPSPRRQSSHRHCSSSSRRRPRTPTRSPSPEPPPLRQRTGPA